MALALHARDDPWLDPASRPGELVRVLLEFAAEQQEPPVLYYQDDPAMSAISRRRDALLGAFRFLMPDAELVEALADKAGFEALAERWGCRRPRRGSSPPTTRLRRALSTCRIPSSSSRPGTLPGGRVSGSRPSKPCDPEALRGLMRELGTVTSRFVVQTRISGPETRIDSYHVYVDAAGERRR